jgi:hypothetical protein
MKYPDKACCPGCFGFVVLPAFTITKPKDSPSGIQFDIATSGGGDNSAFWASAIPLNTITVNSTITANANDRILFSFPTWLIIRRLFQEKVPWNISAVGIATDTFVAT